MITEYPILGFRQEPAADQTEIRHEFFVLAAPGALVIRPLDGMQRHAAQVLLLCRTIPKTGITSPKYSAQHTVTWLCRFVPFPHAKSQSVALHTGVLG